VLSLSLMVCIAVPESRAQIKFSVDNYKQLAEASSSATIPNGTAEDTVGQSRAKPLPNKAVWCSSD
jgi:hypothetical protein